MTAPTNAVGMAGQAGESGFGGRVGPGGPGGPGGRDGPGGSGGRTKRPGPSLAFALIVIALGVLVAVPSVVEAVLPWVRTLSSTPSHSTPGVAHVHLSPGEYRVFERTGTRRGVGGATFGRSQSVTIEPQDVRVTGEDGTRVGVTFPRTTETLTRGSRVYSAAVAFKITDGGDYDVAVAPPAPTEIIISRSLGDTFKQSLPWIGASVSGALVLVVGIVLLIVGIVRRSRANRPVFVPSMAGPAPGSPWGPGPGPWGPGPGPAPWGPGAGAGAGAGAGPTPWGPGPTPWGPGAGAGVAQGAGMAGPAPYATWPPRPQPAADAPPPVGPPPGWYTDPGDPKQLRYWDGGGWTDQTR